MPVLKAEFDLDDSPLPLQAPTVSTSKTLGVLMKRKPAGEAGIGYEIFRTPDQEVARILREKRQIEDPKPYKDALEFCTLFLTLSARTHDPDKWGIRWARYRFDIDGPNLTIPNYAPTLEGIRPNVKNQDAKGFKGNMGAELGPSTEISSTKKNDTGESKATASVGAKVTSGIEFNWSRQNETSFVGLVEEVVGSDERDVMDGGINLTWDVKASPATQVPGDMGKTISVPAAALIGFAKGQRAMAKPTIYGKARSHRLGIVNAFSRLDLPPIQIRPTPD